MIDAVGNPFEPFLTYSKNANAPDVDCRDAGKEHLDRTITLLLREFRLPHCGHSRLAARGQLDPLWTNLPGVFSAVTAAPVVEWLLSSPCRQPLSLVWILFDGEELNCMQTRAAALKGNPIPQGAWLRSKYFSRNLAVYLIQRAGEFQISAWFNWRSLRDYSALRASPLRGRPAADRRRCAAASNPCYSLERGVRR